MILPALSVVAARASSVGDANSAFERARVALVRGARAEAAGDSAAEAAAGQALRASGASPAPGSVDLATAWLGPARAAAEVERDRAIGPAYRALTLAAGGSATFQQTFLGGRRARISVVAAGRAAFDLRVFDDSNLMVCLARAPHGQCDWVPAYTVRVAIKLDNPGREATRYILVLQ